MRVSHFKKTVGYSGFISASLIMFCLILGLIASPVSAEYGYTNKWMGSSDWINEPVNTTLEKATLLEKLHENKESEKNSLSNIRAGKEFLKSKSYFEAKLSFESPIQTYPEWFDAWLGRGFSHEGLMRYQTAVDSYEKAISFAKSEKYAWVAHAGLGRALLEQMQYQKAQDAYLLALDTYEKSGSNASEDRKFMYLGLSDAYQKLGNKNEAAAALKEAEAIKPSE